MTRPGRVIRGVHCVRCGYYWWPTRPGRPTRCAGCGDPNWDRPRKFERPDLRKRKSQ